MTSHLCPLHPPKTNGCNPDNPVFFLRIFVAPFPRVVFSGSSRYIVFRGCKALATQSPKLKLVMEPKYLAFRRWLYTPGSSSDVWWARIPRERIFCSKPVAKWLRITLDAEEILDVLGLNGRHVVHGAVLMKCVMYTSILYAQRIHVGYLCGACLNHPKTLEEWENKHQCLIGEHHIYIYITFMFHYYSV